MKLLNDLLFTDYGLMSLVVIVIVLGMAAFFIRLFFGKMNSSAPAARTTPHQGTHAH